MLIMGACVVSILINHYYILGEHVECVCVIIGILMVFGFILGLNLGVFLILITFLIICCPFITCFVVITMLIPEKKEKESQNCNKDKELDEKNICKICYDNENNVETKCNHKICSVCLSKINKCPFCRESI
jgi:hypothetical protein